jgi:hypothetical protein
MRSEAYRVRNLEQARLRRQNEDIRVRDREQATLRRQNESGENRQLRIERELDRTRLRLQNESIDNRQCRLDKNRERNSNYRQKERLRRQIESSENLQRQFDERRLKWQSKGGKIFDNGGFNYYDNFDKETKECNCYYTHHEFVKSHNMNDWEKAKESEVFGFQRMKGHQSLELYWNKKCGECHAMYLNGESQAFMKKCCGSFKPHGMSCEPTGVADLPPLLPSIKEAINNYPVHMSKYSQTYNNLLSFGAIGVDNKRGGGFEKGFKGPHAATLNGRTYHKTHDQSSSNPSSGLGYIFFDNLQKLNENSEKFEDMKQDILQTVYEDIKRNNCIAQEIMNLGNIIFTD